MEGGARARAERRVVAGLLGARHRPLDRGRSRQRQVLVSAGAPSAARTATLPIAEIAALKATLKDGTQ